MSMQTFEAMLHTKMDVLTERIRTYIRNHTGGCACDAEEAGHLARSERMSSAMPELSAYPKVTADNPELIEAAGTGDLQRVFALLYCEGANPNVRSTSGATALLQATLNGRDNLGVIELLLECGVDVNAATSDGLTALMVAVVKGHHTIIDILLKAGADVRARDMFGYTALSLAKRLGNFLIAEMLVAAVDKKNVA